MAKQFVEIYHGTDIFVMRLNRPHVNNQIDGFLGEHLLIALKGISWKNTVNNKFILIDIEFHKLSNDAKK